MRLNQKSLPTDYTGVSVSFTDEADTESKPTCIVADAAITVQRDSWYRAAVQIALPSEYGGDPAYRTYQVMEIMRWLDAEFNGACRNFQYDNAVRYIKLTALLQAEKRSQTLSEYRFYDCPKEVVKRYDAGNGELSAWAVNAYNSARRIKRRESKEES